MEKLEAGGQVLVMPPWIDGGFAGLPALRLLPAPGSELILGSDSFAVSASNAIEPSPSWQAHGLFSDSKLAWLVSHEPFAGAGQAWLATAELLVASPSTRPRDAKQLTAAVAAHLASFCRPSSPVVRAEDERKEARPSEFGPEDVPYLLAAAGLSNDTDVEAATQFVVRRIGVEPDVEHIERIMQHPNYRCRLAPASWCERATCQSHRRSRFSQLSAGD